MKPSGGGEFRVTDPSIQISFAVSNPAWPDKGSHELRIDNVRLFHTIR
jgi:hypothetical protein